MQLPLRILLLIGVLLGSAVGELRRYDGYQVWRVTGDPPKLKEFVAVLRDVTSLGDTLLTATPQYADLLLPPTLLPSVSDLALRTGVTVSVVQNDVQRTIASQRMAYNNRRRFKNSKIELAEYHTFEEIELYLQELAETYDNVSLTSVGQTYEGRDLWVVRVQGSSAEDKPAVWIDCGIHAREWITPATCLWILSSLTTQYGVDPSVTLLLDFYDVHMMPVVNPDGYAFSWTDDRLWRKNRNPLNGSLCVGVDLNRNFNGTDWGGIGASSVPCEGTYHGAYPFSEPETTAISQQMLQLSTRKLSQFLKKEARPSNDQSAESTGETKKSVDNLLDDSLPERSLLASKPIELSRVTRKTVEESSVIGENTNDYSKIAVGGSIPKKNRDEYDDEDNDEDNDGDTEEYEIDDDENDELDAGEVDDDEYNLGQSTARLSQRPVPEETNVQGSRSKTLEQKISRGLENAEKSLSSTIEHEEDDETQEEFLRDDDDAKNDFTSMSVVSEMSEGNSADEIKSRNEAGLTKEIMEKTAIHVPEKTVVKKVSGNVSEQAEISGLAISFSLHSYGALWLYAYGYTAELPPDHEEMERVSAAGVAGIEAVNGSVYTPGPHYTTIYPATGTVVDYGYEQIGLVHTYLIEAFSDGHGFLLPESLIAVTAEGVWRGILAAVEAL